MQIKNSITIAVFYSAGLNFVKGKVWGFWVWRQVILGEMGSGTSGRVRTQLI